MGGGRANRLQPRRAGCLAPFVIRWGPDASSDVLRERLKCAKCGKKGATLKHPSWYEWGWQPWPGTNYLNHVTLTIRGP